MPYFFKRAESKLCFTLWILAVFYSIYCFSITSQKYFENFHDHYQDFQTGWPILSPRKKDKADFEWETYKYYFNHVYIVLILYVLLSETLRFSKYHKKFQILFSLGYIIYIIDLRGCLVTLIQPVLFFLVKSRRSMKIWLCSFVCLMALNWYKHWLTDSSSFHGYLQVLLLAWLNLKCTHFALTIGNSKFNMIDYLSYLLYLPTLFTGPFVEFEDFKHCYQLQNFQKFPIRFAKLIGNLLKCLFWYFFVEFTLHFVYCNAASFQLELIKNLTFCSLCGYGYLMGQFFHLKYVILYGFSTSWAVFENIPVPHLPRCIGRVHLYSDMWKYFDPGLHKFLKNSIFIPCQQTGLSKLQSSFVCFFFVFLWHGIEQYILIWATLNFIGLAMENLIKKLSNNRQMKNACSAPLLALSAISNFYFFAGKDVGDVFVWRCLTESSMNIILILGALYCCCEVSTELGSLNANKM